MAFPRTAAAAQEPVRLLDVPYLPQSEALCGGAAAAMVMRYWGAGVVYADTFAPLVDKDAGGIRGDDLRRALVERGWEAVAFAGSPSMVTRHLASRRPVIALIEDRPNRFHYVVVVGWAGGRVIAHDPARAPFRLYDEPAFLDAWSKAGYWTLLALPGDAAMPAPVPPADHDAARRAAGPCAAMVAEGVRLAGGGDLDQARRLLQLAADACPQDSGPLRELAGIDVVRRDWQAAAGHARAALRRDGSDAHAARILASSLFLQDDGDGALAAWNRIGEPVVDLVSIVGLERVRYAVAADLLRLRPREVLTAGKMAMARRRLAELPAAAVARVSYAPGESGRANIEAVIVERPLLPTSPIALAAVGVRAAADREVSATVAAPTGGGETLTASWRWWQRRPRVSLAFEAPSPSSRFGSIWRLDAIHDRQTYAAGLEIEETRRELGVAIADWLSERWRWEMGVALNHWNGRGSSAVVSAALERRSRDERWSVTAGGALHAGGVDALTVSARTTWSSSRRMAGDVWHARAGTSLAGSGSPFGLWPGAGSEPGREGLLRAHPLLTGGVVDGGVFGRHLLHGGVEWRRWLQPGARPWRFAPAVFVDLAHAARTGGLFDSRAHVDVGAGVRVGVPGTGAVRVDVARGLRDGRMALSIGWVR